METAKFKKINFTHLNQDHFNTMKEWFEIHLAGHPFDKKIIYKETRTHKVKKGNYWRLTDEVEVRYAIDDKVYTTHAEMIKDIDLPVKENVANA